MQLTLDSATAAANAPKQPFQLHLPPGQAVTHPNWAQAQAAIHAALSRGESVALLGPPGTGKTLLLQDLAQRLRHEGWPVRLVEHGDALEPVQEGAVVLVDEAGRMDTAALSSLLRRATARFVLAALPSFAERLADVPESVTPVALGPLSPEEVARFVAARLSAAGRPRTMLEPDAVLALAKHSAGQLRLVNILGGAAVYLAELENAPRVCRRHVDEAASMRDGLDDGGNARPSAEPDQVETPERGSIAAPSGPPVLPPVDRRRRAVLAAAVLGIGAVAAGSLVLLRGGGGGGGSRTTLPLTTQRPDREGVEHLPSTPDSQSPGLARTDSGSPAGLSPGDAGPSRSETAAAAAPRKEAPAAPAGERQTGERPDSRQGSPAQGTLVSFRGPVMNETMQQGGQMSLAIRKPASSPAVTAQFHAWGGLLGTGELAGSLSSSGQLLLSGQLMMGRNAFTCDLKGRIVDDRLIGSATFVRSGGTSSARSSFTLTRF